MKQCRRRRRENELERNKKNQEARKQHLSRKEKRATNGLHSSPKSKNKNNTTDTEDDSDMNQLDNVASRGPG